MIRRASIQVTGIVQGVYYRYTTQRKADEFGLAGTVKNMPDGSVRIVCEGEEETILRLVEWCKQGPQGARVDYVDVRWEEPTGRFSNFTIDY
jgi:acylphosphatase